MKNITNQYLSMVTNNEGNAHDKFWAEYEKQKSVKLSDLFGDKLIIEKPITIVKEHRDIREDICDKRLSEEILNSLDQEFYQAVHRHDLFSWKRETMTSEEEIALDRKTAASYILNNTHLANQTLSDNYSFISPITNKEVKLQKGSKISKALKHFISDPVKLEKVQTLYSQILNDKFLKGTLCLSIHPMDYLTASVNDSGWDSCYNTMDKGAYCASTTCLLNSPNTFIAYLKSSKDMQVGWSQDKIEWNNKRWRTWVTLGKHNDICHIGRNYPYESNALMQEVADMVAELTQQEYLPLEENRDFIRIYTPYNMYNDAEHSDLYVCMTEKYKLSAPIYGKEEIYVSGGSLCPICGQHFDDVECDIVCADCGEFERCHDCGCIAQEGERTWIEDIEGYVCDCCSDNYFYCESCGDYHTEENIVRYANSYHPVYGYCYEYMCEYCINRCSSVVTCECCGEWFADDALREDGRCHDCPREEIEADE